MRKLIALSAFALIAACAQEAPAPVAGEAPAADETTALIPARGEDFEIVDGWAPATPGAATVAAGYLTISNGTAETDRLIGASSTKAGRVEIHEMTMDGDMMQMRAVNGVDVPAETSVSLIPGGLHLMFLEVTAPFEDGESVPLTLTFERAGVIETTLTVRPRSEDQSHGAH